jgi:hypothetical protein
MKNRESKNNPWTLKLLLMIKQAYITGLFTRNPAGYPAGYIF